MADEHNPAEAPQSQPDDGGSEDEGGTLGDILKFLSWYGQSSKDDALGQNRVFEELQRPNQEYELAQKRINMFWERLEAVPTEEHQPKIPVIRPGKPNDLKAEILNFGNVWRFSQNSIAIERWLI